MNKEQLIARVEELKIEVPEGATNPQIIDLIKIVEHPTLVKDLKTAKEELEGQKELTKKLQKEHDTETKKVAEANELIAELEEKLTIATTTPEVEKGETYQNEAGEFEFTVASFRFKSEKYIAKEAVANKELMEELIEAKFSFLKQVK